jgi:hypothetical protein
MQAKRLSFASLSCCSRRRRKFGEYGNQRLRPPDVESTSRHAGSSPGTSGSFRHQQTARMPSHGEKKISETSAANVRSWLQEDIRGVSRNVRFTPRSGHCAGCRVHVSGRLDSAHS